MAWRGPLQQIGNGITPEQLAERTLLEQHPDDSTKLHIYVYSRHPFKNKGSDVGKSWFDKKMMPAIEVKCMRSLMFCTPSMHQNGSHYQFMKQTIPIVWDDLEQIIDEILKKYNIIYLSDADKSVRSNQQKVDETKTVNEGSRHVELLREMNTRLHEFIQTKPIEEIKRMCIKFNNLYCRPPLPSQEFERMWKDAHAYVIGKKKEEGKKLVPDRTVSHTDFELISVAEAIRRSSGKVAVNGIIVGTSSVIQ